MSNSEFARPLSLLIDGPSGAGKTWLAAYLRKRWRASRSLVVLHMDDLYRGWSGLEEASGFIEDVVMPARRDAQPVRWQRFDWATQQLADWHEIPATADLIIEGCGSITRSTTAHADLSIWINADDEARKEWALSRGGEDFERHWNLWDIQFQRFREEHAPERYASLVVRQSR